MQKEKIGFGLTALGLLVGISAAAKKAPQLGQFPDTTLAWLASAIIAIIGVILWRQGVKANATQSHAEHSAETDPITQLNALMEQSHALQALSLEQTAHQILDKIERVSQNYILPLGNARSFIQNKFGLDKGTQILSELATAERYFNRAASAAADGHRPEALTSLKTAHATLERTVGLL